MKKEYLVSAKEMQQYDHNTIEKIRIPACVLMERAAYEVAMETLSFLQDIEDAKILIMAGNGNNGADGVCTGRILMEYGVTADICLIKKDPPYAEELQRQLEIADYYHLKQVSFSDVRLQEYDLLIDAMFGVGLNREITGTIKEIIESINMEKIPVISVDIPSGIDAASGKILGCAVKADITVTFGFYKRGQWFYPGRMYCGKLKKVKIAIDETGFFGEKPRMFTYLPKEQTQSKDRPRDPMGNKGTFGKVFVVAGRASTTGAAILCASSALRSGCGMVAVFTQQENKEIFLQSIPEIMVETYTNEESFISVAEKIQKWMDWSDTVVIGCGLGRDERAYDMVKYVLHHADFPVVCDADALQLIACNEELTEEIQQYKRRQKNDKNEIIFTPHPGELAALARCGIADIKEDRMVVIRKILEKYPVILAAKDADTLVCSEDHDSYLNITGNDGLSTAGSGDVLAGLTASMVAQGIRNNMTTFESVCKSVYLHGKAADVLAEESGKSFLVASDLIEAYKYILE